MYRCRHRDEDGHVKAERASDYAAKLLPGYVVPKGAQSSSRVAVFNDNVEPSQNGLFCKGGDGVLGDFESYLEVKYGTRKPQTALLSAEVRDLGRVPAFSPTLQAMAATEVLKIMTKPSVLESDKLLKGTSAPFLPKRPTVV